MSNKMLVNEKNGVVLIDRYTPIFYTCIGLIRWKGDEMDKKELLTRCTNTLTKELPVLRKICRLTQQQLGDIVGVSRQTIANIESGRYEMKWSLFLAFMFLFSLDDESAVYLKQCNIPFDEVKEWLNSIRM